MVHKDNKYFHIMFGIFNMDEDKMFDQYASVLLKLITNQDAYEKYCSLQHPLQDPFRCSYGYLYARPVREIDSTQ